MEFLFGLLGALCAAYYVIIVIYAGFGTSFSLIWPVFAACFFLLSAACRFLTRFREKVPLSIEVYAITAVAASFVIFLAVEIQMGLSVLTQKNYKADYLIVLGAQVKGETPGRSLSLRLEKALDYAEDNPDTVLILSGGKGNGEDISEAEAMYRFFTANGIEGSRLIKEESSRTTRENLAYSKMLIEERESARFTDIRKALEEKGYQTPPAVGMNLSVALVTNNFHVMRSVMTARKLGYANVCGVAAKSDPVLFWHLCVRECFAILKDKVVGNI